MIVGERLRALREERNFSQGEIEKRTGLLRCYISRVENGHTVPAVETLEKFARALEVPMYQLLYDGEKPPQLPNLRKTKTAGEAALGRFRERCSNAGTIPPVAGQNKRGGSTIVALHCLQNGEEKQRVTVLGRDHGCRGRRWRRIARSHRLLYPAIDNMLLAVVLLSASTRNRYCVFRSSISPRMDPLELVRPIGRLPVVCCTQPLIIRLQNSQP